MVKDAAAAAMLPERDGCQAAIINFRYIADALWSAEEAVKQILGKAQPELRLRASAAARSLSPAGGFA